MKVIIFDEVPLLVPADEFSRYDSLALSDRSKRTKLIAQYRPDATWQSAQAKVYSYLHGSKIYTLKIDGDNQQISDSPLPVLHGNYIEPPTALAKSVRQADDLVQAMRNIVQ